MKQFGNETGNPNTGFSGSNIPDIIVNTVNQGMQMSWDSSTGGSTLLIGRGEECTLRLKKVPGISRKHCMLTKTSDGWVLRDLNASYGTWLGSGKKLKPEESVLLRFPETIYLGSDQNVLQVMVKDVSSVSPQERMARMPESSWQSQGSSYTPSNGLHNANQYVRAQADSFSGQMDQQLSGDNGVPPHYGQSFSPYAASDGTQSQKPVKNKKKWLIAVGAVIGALLLFIVGGSLMGDDDSQEVSRVNKYQGAGTADTSEWGIYVYMCGSDLESEYGQATVDMMQMLRTEPISDDVKVIVETGGASQWMSAQEERTALYNNFEGTGIDFEEIKEDDSLDAVDGKKIQRFELTEDEGFVLVDEQKQASMGDADTLADFLAYCTASYPAEHQMVVLWNHGAGVDGVCFDEQYPDNSPYGIDYLELSEIHSAFEAAVKVSKNNPPFEIIGFDACLMANLETASAIQDCGNYMVASQETELCGWNWTEWLAELSENPSMTPEDLTGVICDIYMELKKSYDDGTDKISTLSAIDLSKIPDLLEAYDVYAQEALTELMESDNSSVFLRDFDRAADKTTNYGLHSRKEGYSNLADLADLAENTDSLTPETADELVKAVEQCVIHNVYGKDKTGSHGISCYYPYGGMNEDDESFDDFEDYISDGFKYFYEYQLTGKLDKEGMEYLEDLLSDDVEIQDASGLNTSTQTIESTVDEDGYLRLTLDQDMMDKASGVYVNVCFVDKEDDLQFGLGYDNNITEDWESGVMTDEFDGNWGCLDGHPVYMEVIEEAEEYVLYSIPILLNGESYELLVDWNYEDAYDADSWEILGAQKSADEETGLPSRYMRQLKAGDQVTTLFWAISLSEEDDEGDFYSNETFEIGDSPAFKWEKLRDGIYGTYFSVVDYQGNELIDENGAIYEISGEEILSSNWNDYVLE